MNVPSVPKWLLALIVLGLGAGSGHCAEVLPPVVKTVGAPGTADFATVQAAIDAMPKRPQARYIIDLKPGTYREVVHIPANKRYLTLRGESAENTVVTFDNSASKIGPDGKAYGTFGSATMFADADDFVAENLTIQNAAGPGRVAGQAVALSVGGDRAVFRHCRILGGQDTIFAAANREYYEDCYIEGDVDYIFGGATAWFERCQLHSIGNGYLTAASTDANAPFGYVFSRCQVTANPGVRFQLGRPWRANASVTFLNTTLPAALDPIGWNNWGNPANEKTARYAEYNSRGADVDLDLTRRVAWAKQLTPAEAGQITLEKVLGGKDGWNPIKGDTNPAAATVPEPANQASLPARDAVILGSNARPENDGANLGFWSNADTDFEWITNLLPGAYDVELVYSVDDANAGSEIRVTAGGQQFKVQPPSTGGFVNYAPLSVGRIQVQRAGALTISVGALSKKGNFILNIKSVNITPAK